MNLRRRWSIGIRGLESGTVTEMTFWRFRRRDQAAAKVGELNARSRNDDLTEYVLYDHREQTVATSAG